MGVSVEQWRPCSDKYYPTKDGSPQTWPVTYIHNTGPPATSPTGAPYPSSPPTPGSFYPSSSPPSRDNDNGGGSNNGTKTTTEHIQTLIDQFLSIFKSSSSETTTSHAMIHEETPSASTPQHVVNGNVDLLPGFQVVDVTDKPQTVGRGIVPVPAAPANQLYSYGTSGRFRNRFIRRKPLIYLVQ